MLNVWRRKSGFWHHWGIQELCPSSGLGKQTSKAKLKDNTPDTARTILGNVKIATQQQTSLHVLPLHLQDLLLSAAHFQISAPWGLSVLDTGRADCSDALHVTAATRALHWPSVLTWPLSTCILLKRLGEKLKACVFLALQWLYAAPSSLCA